ncbi:MAG: DUF3820 family protein [Bacteroidia bacterium]|nr:DUF3820 family protein [Bacteroidia bacterium]MBT8275327.1 DUF3820 family protein [Bacteroidia bacterium]NNJ83210.1 DUF3820 family protein [Flavobacteriaceae bacterium]NNK54989.1 DUF3820 family protein [Flavobacteriaceae bacterium]NNM09607.1 DUF3820 family protein [Flavobacteriaceae bacterium]
MTAGNKKDASPGLPDPNHLIILANYRMPYGKYKGKYLIDLPEAYYVWFKQKGFPEGKLGHLMMEMHELKVNGLDGMLRKLIR